MDDQRLELVPSLLRDHRPCRLQARRPAEYDFEKRAFDRADIWVLLGFNACSDSI